MQRVAVYLSSEVARLSTCAEVLAGALSCVQVIVFLPASVQSSLYICPQFTRHPWLAYLPRGSACYHTILSATTDNRLSAFSLKLSGERSASQRLLDTSISLRRQFMQEAV